MPLGYYKDEAKTAKTFPVVDGVRYSVPGDRAGIDEKGLLRLFGRDSVTINSGGEKIFAEEVEHALKHHPSVYDAVVVGTPSERWGQQVTAIVKLREGERPSEDALREAARAHIAPYKLPKVFVFVDEIVRSPSGKADYRWAKATALARLNPAAGVSDVFPQSRITQAASASRRRHRRDGWLRYEASLPGCTTRPGRCVEAESARALSSQSSRSGLSSSSCNTVENLGIPRPARSSTMMQV